jgi:hypothetical protein
VLRHAAIRALAVVGGRLQAAHLSGPRSDPDAASSGPELKAPGSAGGYLLLASRGGLMIDADLVSARTQTNTYLISAIRWRMAMMFSCF